MVNKQRKPKAEKLPFWKSEKIPPELRSIFAHIGKAADNMTHAQWSELILNGGLVGMSVYAFAPVIRRASYDVHHPPTTDPSAILRETKRLTDQEAKALRDQGYFLVQFTDPKPSWDKVFDLSVIPNAFIGPLALKLATTQGGTPPVSQMAGLASLAAMGLNIAYPDVMKDIVDQLTHPESKGIELAVPLIFKVFPWL